MVVLLFAELLNTSELFPPAPPSTVPVAANPNANPVTGRAARPTLPPSFNVDPVTAVNVFVLPAPSDTLPLIVPSLVNVLPAPGVPLA